MAKKILLLSLSAGAGHVRAAQSILEHAQRSHPDALIEHRDIIDFVSLPMRIVYRDFYHLITKNAPLVWGYLYKKTNSPSIRETLHTTASLQALLAPSLAEYIKSFQPDALICTHFVCAEIATSILRDAPHTLPVSTIITDYEIHHLWMTEGVTRYFVATEEMKKDLLQAGIPPERVVVSGIPTSPSLVEVERRAPELYARFTMDASRPVILVLSGGTGLQDISSLIQTLFSSKIPLQICAVAGSNTILKEKLNALTPPPHIRLTIFDFIQDIHNLYALADVVISKAGGLTVTECITRAIPLIITNPLPGQESANAHFLHTNKAALQAKTPQDVRAKTHRILTNSALRNELIQHMKKIARPEAAQTILDTTIGM